MTDLDTIVQGNAVDVMRGMDSESVDCITTSPPYYGLRSYQTEPQIWGGLPDCDHRWGEDMVRKTSDNYNVGFNERWGNSPGERKQEKSSYGKIEQGNFCTLCNAWRGELGSEPTPPLFIAHLGTIFGECKRVLKKRGTMFVNLADSYAGSGSPGGDFRDGKGGDEYLRPYNRKFMQAKSQIGIPERFVIMMLDAGWIYRNTIIWYKKSVMPESVKDRFTRDFEYIYFFTKSQDYYFEQQFEQLSESYLKDNRPLGVIRQHLYSESKYVKAGIIEVDEKYIKEPKPRLAKHRAWDNDPILSRGKGENAVMRFNEKGRNMRCVWELNNEPLKDAHFAHYPQELVRRCLQAGCPEGGVVLDPFMGSGSTGLVAKKMNRHYIGIELNPEYINIANRRIEAVQEKLI